MRSHGRPKRSQIPTSTVRRQADLGPLWIYFGVVSTAFDATKGRGANYHSYARMYRADTGAMIAGGVAHEWDGSDTAAVPDR